MYTDHTQRFAPYFPSDLDARLYKTQLCWFFQNGCCLRKFCRFGHGEAELRPRPHLWKTTMCHFVVDRGYCRDRYCNFAHDESELRAVTRATSQRYDTKQTANDPERHMKRASPHPGPFGHMSSPAPASGGGGNVHVESPPASQQALRPTALVQIDFLRYPTEEELVTLFRTISPEQLILAQPATYSD